MADLPLAQIDVKGKEHEHRRKPRKEHIAYLHTDHLGTPRLATDANQAIVWRWDSDGFGAERPEHEDDPEDEHKDISVTLRFPGQYFDKETGLFYNWNRYYDPRTGRYITSDPIGLRGGLNTFVYAENNSLRFVDPFGLVAQPGDNSIYPPSMNCSCTLNCQACRGGKTPICDILPIKDLKIRDVRIPILETLCKEIEGGFSCARQCAEFCSGRSKVSPFPDSCNEKQNEDSCKQ